MFSEHTISNSTSVVVKESEQTPVVGSGAFMPSSSEYLPVGQRLPVKQNEKKHTHNTSALERTVTRTWKEKTKEKLGMNVHWWTISTPVRATYVPCGQSWHADALALAVMFKYFPALQPRQAMLLQSVTLVVVVGERERMSLAIKPCRSPYRPVKSSK